MKKISVDFGVLEDGDMKVEGSKEFVHEQMRASQVRVMRVKYIVRRITQREFLEPILAKFVQYLEGALKKVEETGDVSIIGEGMMRQADALFLSVQPGFELSKSDKEEIREMCLANGVEIPKGD